MPLSSWNASSGKATSRRAARAISLGVAGLAVALVWMKATDAWAQETVYLGGTSGSKGHAILSGKVLDYTGRELVLETADGQKRRYPSEKIIKIETQYPRQQVEADALFARGEFAAALALYTQARSADSRTWVRRQITAQIVWCHRARGELHQACEEFLILIRSDPDTFHFHSIPLAWVPSEPSLALEQAARTWLDRDDLPAAGLLGASHLISTSSRPQALARLKSLSTHDDPRIEWLAITQTWRATAATIDDRRLASWPITIERMPESLRPGPYYVLGRAWLERERWEQAALAFLRVPILYPEHRELAARALADAGWAMEKLDRPSGATRLYRELIETLPDSPLATEARDRLERMTQKKR